MEEEEEEEMEELPFDSRRINKNDITLETWPKGQTASQLTGWSVHSQLLSANNFISQIYGQLLEITKRRERKKNISVERNRNGRAKNFSPNDGNLSAGGIKILYDLITCCDAGIVRFTVNVQRPIIICL